ncbi:hypothetical protein QQY24_22200 [Streptomyces sp. TG1A-8]|uniref:hypothetical protein n=1 Tax=Streptomyces sp. TG1A-8 TaxID=3051385 RepID=UPI00265C4B82|nr:hypothetical protein [Streptomyces sp. TG1A-8]MDO0927984.1 hypothetical protein [Streptomyces sp. TG1A-8]
MPDHSPTAHDTTLCVEELRTALALHGIKLPSLRVDLPSFAGSYEPPAGLVALGNCNTATARALAAALRRTAGE